MPMKVATKENTLINEVDEYCQYALDQWRVPGVAVSIVHKGKVIFEKGYGTQKYGENISVTTETLFPTASITESFAVMSLALLVEQGKLKWTGGTATFLDNELILKGNEDFENETFILKRI